MSRSRDTNLLRCLGPEIRTYYPSRCVLRPRDTAEVSRLLRHCSARNLAVCPQVT